MIGIIKQLEGHLSSAGFDLDIPNFTQEMTEQDLSKIIGNYDGWIIGDDPASRPVLEAGRSGKLRACMRWGVGTNNVDFEAFKELDIPIENTPGVFGNEVADLAMHYVTGLLRDTFSIDRSVRSGGWFKPIGRSLWNTRTLIVGMGDVGQNLAKRLIAHGMTTSFFDPYVDLAAVELPISKVSWPHCLSKSDVVVFTAPLTNETYHMFNDDVLEFLKADTKVVNVGRGQLISQTSLAKAFTLGLVSGAALDVFEQEPFKLEASNPLNQFSEKIIFGSHNGSNTQEAVHHVSTICINRLKEFLDG